MFFVGWGGGGWSYEDFIIIWGGGHKIGLVFWGYFYAIFGHFLRTELDGDSLGVTKISILFIYLILN